MAVTGPEVIVVSGFVFAYLPWLLLGGRKQELLYYLLPAVPFMCLALAHAAFRIFRNDGAIVLGALAGCVAASLVYFYPVLTAVPLSRPAWEARVPFRDSSRDPVQPTGPPPPGWCWA